MGLNDYNAVRRDVAALILQLQQAGAE